MRGLPLLSRTTLSLRTVPFARCLGVHAHRALHFKTTKHIAGGGGDGPGMGSSETVNVAVIAGQQQRQGGAGGWEGWSRGVSAATWVLAGAVFVHEVDTYQATLCLCRNTPPPCLTPFLFSYLPPLLPPSLPTSLSPILTLSPCHALTCTHHLL